MRAGLERAAPSAVDARAVFVQPRAHFFQTRDLPGFDLAGGLRADAEQKVAVAADGLDESLEAVL